MDWLIAFAVLAVLFWASGQQDRPIYILKARPVGLTPCGEIIWELPDGAVVPAEEPGGTGSEVSAT